MHMAQAWRTQPPTPPKRFVKLFSEVEAFSSNGEACLTVRELVPLVVLTAYDRGHGFRRSLSLATLRIPFGESSFVRLSVWFARWFVPCGSCSRCGFWCVVVTTPFVFGQTSPKWVRRMENTKEKDILLRRNSAWITSSGALPTSMQGRSGFAKQL